MKKKKLIIIAAVIVVIVIIAIITDYSFYTVVPMQEKTESGLVADQSDKDFDSDAYAASIWGEVEVYSTDNASPIADVLALYSEDKQTCIDTYCLTELTEVQTASFIVSGNVNILDVNRDSKIGLMSIDVAPYDGEADAVVQIGPVYKNNFVRDEMPFIIFEDFMNQLAFGEAGKAINRHIDSTVVIPMALDEKVGQEIFLVGIFSDVDDVVITPVVLGEAK